MDRIMADLTAPIHAWQSEQDDDDDRRQRGLPVDGRVTPTAVPRDGGITAPATTRR